MQMKISQESKDFILRTRTFSDCGHDRASSTATFSDADGCGYERAFSSTFTDADRWTSASASPTSYNGTLFIISSVEACFSKTP